VAALILPDLSQAHLLPVKVFLMRALCSDCCDELLCSWRLCSKISDFNVWHIAFGHSLISNSCLASEVSFNIYKNKIGNSLSAFSLLLTLSFKVHQSSAEYERRCCLDMDRWNAGVVQVGQKKLFFEIQKKGALKSWQIS